MQISAVFVWSHCSVALALSKPMLSLFCANMLLATLFWQHLKKKQQLIKSCPFKKKKKGNLRLQSTPPKKKIRQTTGFSKNKI